MFKKLLLAAGLPAAIGLAVPQDTSAQQYKTDTVAITNTVAAATTTTVSTATYVVTKTDEVAVTGQLKLTAAGTGTATLVFETSPDGTTYNGPTHTINITCAGTVTASTTSNLNVGALGYIRLKSIGNPDDDGVVTNVAIKYTTKPERRGQ